MLTNGVGVNNPRLFLMREAVKILVERFNKECVPVMGAEIGVCFGSNARDMLDGLPQLHLHLVDDLSEMLGPKDIHDNYEYNYLTEVGRDLKGVLPTRYTWHKVSSTDASRNIPDESLEFVYIDANHAYEYALQDCRLWWWKVKKGGVLCGHDYTLTFPDAYTKKVDTHVEKAVEKFAEQMNLKVYHAQNKDDKNTGHAPIHDWWIFKDV